MGLHTTHKPRSVWFEQASAFPFRDADPSQVERRMYIDPHQQPQAWEPMGPVNFAGRVTCLAIHPVTGMLYAGAAAGGVWRSPDLGRNWLPPSPDLQPPIDNKDLERARIVAWPTNNIGALAIDPHNPDHILCATGEANGSADAYPGCGIFHSRDAGETWHVLAFSTDAGLPRRIGALAIDPADPNHIVAGGITHMESEAAGLFVSKDGGLTWTVHNAFGKSYYCHSAVFGSDGSIYFTADMRGASNGIARIGGQPVDNQFAPPFGVRNGLPENLRFGRTSLARSQSHPDTLYALAGDRHGKLLGVFRTDDAGNTWRQAAAPENFPLEHQWSYTNCIAIHPADPDFVAIGGLDLYVTRNGGRTWRHATNDFAKPGAPNAVHGDHHAILILDNGTIVTGGDGGVYVSEDGGRSWSPRTTGMQTTMFYALGVAAKNHNAMGGGCQDNGTLVRDDRDPERHFRYVIGGDGAWLAYDRDDPEIIFGGYHEAHVFRHHKGVREFWVNVSPPIRRSERKVRAIAVLAIEPFCRKGQRRKFVYLGTDRLWRTANQGKSWKPVSPVFDGTAVSAIAIAPHDPDLLMVGTTRGGIFRSVDGAKHWTENFAGAEIPMRLISSIKIFKVPDQPQGGPEGLSIRAICTVAGTGLGGAPVPKAFRGGSGPEILNHGYSHVFVSVMMGKYGWKDADGGRLPDMAYQCCAFEEQPPYRIFIGGDFGVFMAKAGGFEALEKSFNLANIPVASQFDWVNITGNLPNVIVSDLVYHQGEAALYASTYGRGIYRLKASTAEWMELDSTAPQAYGKGGGWIASSA